MVRFNRLGSKKLCGQAAVEFILVIPMLLIMLAFVSDISNMVSIKERAESEAGNAARWAASQLWSKQSIDQQKVIDYVQSSSGAHDAKVTYSTDERAGDQYTVHLLDDSGNETKSTAAHNIKTVVTVTVSLPYNPIIPIWGTASNGEHALQGSATVEVTTDRKVG